MGASVSAHVGYVEAGWQSGWVLRGCGWQAGRVAGRVASRVAGRVAGRAAGRAAGRVANVNVWL